MQLSRFQNLSSLKRVHTASFSMSSTYFASCLRKVMTFSSTIEGTAQPPEPIRRRSMVSPLSVMVIGDAQSIVAGVADGDRADHRALARGEEVQLLAQRVHRDLEVLDDGVGLVLLLERVLLRVADRVLGDVVEVADAGGLAGVDELLAGLAHQEGLHELLRHRHVEEVALLLLAAELHQAPLLAPAHVGERPHRDVEERVLSARHRLQHALGQLLDLGRRLLRDRVLAHGLLLLRLGAGLRLRPGLACLELQRLPPPPSSPPP